MSQRSVTGASHICILTRPSTQDNHHLHLTADAIIAIHITHTALSLAPCQSHNAVLIRETNHHPPVLPPLNAALHLAAYQARGSSLILGIARRQASSWLLWLSETNPFLGCLILSHNLSLHLIAGISQALFSHALWPTLVRIGRPYWRPGETTTLLISPKQCAVLQCIR